MDELDQGRTIVGDFERAKRTARRRRIMARLLGRDINLLPFEEVRHSLGSKDQGYRGVRPVRIDQIINGKVINSRTENFNIEHPAFMSGQFAGEDVANVGGRTYSCFVILQGNRRLLFSHEVPVTGLVVEFRGGAPLREVVDFGY